MNHEDFLNQMKKMIDDLKSMSTDFGLSNTGDEYKIISDFFTYKFLNEKIRFHYENHEQCDISFDDFIDIADLEFPKMHQHHFIDHLYQQKDGENFHEILEQAFREVNTLNKELYHIEMASGRKRQLFEPLSVYIRDEEKELGIARRAIGILVKYKFRGIHNGGFDYFSSIFEYLIRDYNKDSGKYAEYFTPLFAGNLIAEILYNDTQFKNPVTIYDPSAGSGTLLLTLANRIGTANCKLYSQDISQKSTHFLRINLILNNLTQSLSNIIEGNTITNPQHIEEGEIKKFDFVVSNPPFKMDCSHMISNIKSDTYNRFFAGIPKIPKKNKGGMAIYELFLQHIIASLSESGKAAIVVPTGFTTAAKGISKVIRQRIVEKNWLRGVLHMPSHIFATTATSVSIIFIDKAKTNNTILLMDASKMGSKHSFRDGRKTILYPEEENKIISYFKNNIEETEFSVLVSNQDILENDCSILAGQYVELKEEDIDFDIDEKLAQLTSSLIQNLHESQKISASLLKRLEE